MFDILISQSPTDPDIISRLCEIGTALGTIGAVAAALCIAKKQSRETLRLTERQSKENITLHMIDRFLDLIESISTESESGAEALRKLYYRFSCINFYDQGGSKGQQRSILWTTITSLTDDKSVLGAVLKFYKEYIDEGKTKGDIETIAYYYLSIFETGSPKIVITLKDLYPQEMAFIVLLTCVVRNDKRAAKTVLDHKILERAMEEDGFPKSTPQIIEKIASGKFNKP